MRPGTRWEALLADVAHWFQDRLYGPCWTGQKCTWRQLRSGL